MSRTLTLFAVLFIVIAAFLLLRNHNSSPQVLEPAVNDSEAIAKQGDSNFHEWREFSFKSGHFKVLMPALPQHVSDTIADPKTLEPRKYETFATASDNGAAFMVNAITFSTQGEAEASEESLKSAVTEILSRNKENKLNEMKMGTFHGANALDFSLSNGDALIEGKVFTHGNTMYVLSMIDKKNSFNRKELDFFINSFDFVDDILPKQKTEVPSK